MGNTNWGLGNCWAFICILLVMMAHKCMGGGNLTTASCHEQERLALLKFKHSVRDYNGMLSTWGVGDDCCRWERVRCDDATGRVVGLYLENNATGRVERFWDSHTGKYHTRDRNGVSLFGEEVNFCLTELVNLKHLDLSGNTFIGRIPEFIGSFKQLRYLNLSQAGFYGNIPHQIGNLSNLKVLDLNTLNWYPRIMTDDMAWISGLSELEHLDLSGTNLSRTQNLHNLLYTIPSLLNLRLSNCRLSMVNFGSCHLNSSRQLASFKQLDLTENNLKGQLPCLFQNMTSLAFLDLSWNNLSMAWSFENLLNIIPSVSDLRLSGCSIQNNNLSPTNLSSSTHSNIQHLDLRGNQIEGKFPSILTNMSSLLSLDLSDNLLESSIPVMPNLLQLDISWNNFRQIEDVGIWRQCHLKELIVSYNSLEGEMIGPTTNVSKCSQNSLEILYLGWNALKCSLPESLGRLTNLRHLDLSSNLLNGNIPKSIGQLTNLYLLDVSNNSLQGVVSEEHFANLSMLKYLYADSNNKLLFNISREWIPPFQLKVVRLRSCKINDEFPQWLRTQRKLEELVLSNAGIYGPLPKWLRLLPIIYFLDFSHNKLTGPLKNLPNVYEVIYQSGGVLLLQNNRFTGLIPRRLCTRTDLQILDLSRNRLIGKIPKCLWNLPVEMMLLSSNRLSGVIPSPPSLSDSPLQWLQLNDNNLDGEIPREFGYFENLEVLDLSENKISGNIPEWIGENMTGLAAFRLYKNNFTGHIPNSLCKAQWCQILDLSHNNLIGSIPHCFGELSGMKRTQRLSWDVFGDGSITQVLKGVALDYTTNLDYLTNIDLSSNRLVGEIPETLTALEALMGLNLSCNQFNGGIPKNIGNMLSLNSLDLSSNELTGIIPQSMAALNFLSHLNLSHNNLSGEIPTGNQLQTLTDPSMYDNNTYLCGAPLPKECSPREKPRTTTSKSKNTDENANDPNKVWFYLDIMSGFATGFWGIIVVLYFKKQWTQKLIVILEVAIDKIYVGVVVKVLKMKRSSA